MSRGQTLRCCACAHTEPYDPFSHRCGDCGEALEIASNGPPAAPADPPMPPRGLGEGMWRYRSLLPDIDGELIARRVFLGEGGTPLLDAAGLGKELDCRVLLKDETRNPTASFKDRGTAAGVAVLAGLGYATIGTVSTGNMARSVAAYAARAGMRATIWVGASTPAEKLAPIAVHGARLLRIDAPYGEIFSASMEWSRRTDVPFVNSDSALRVEGQKTIAYELAEQLGGQAPNWLIVPTSSGGNFSAIARGLQDAVDGGWLRGDCRLVVVQSAECDPIVRAWDAGADQPIPVPPPTTIAGAISNPTPPSGARALRWLRRFDGVAVAVPDADIEAAQLRLAAATGRFVQPASAAGLAALEVLRREEVVQVGDSVVLLLTGAGTNAAPPAVPVDEPVSLVEAMETAR